MFLNNEQINIDKEGSELNISHGFAFSNIYNSLNFRSVCDRHSQRKSFEDEGDYSLNWVTLNAHLFEIIE